ncbi:serrate RNA effector molecule homolog isoform X1 [Tribolium castaneum]|uniref:serrate RNA effector molecule homolog isoform X1 n=1 Tax=Tribolium castaneum TaxID=7070 RepID=UPI00046BFBC9|nr:PREDICTED: serrate RNA effector molecule homolog isoform X1 [Tribolium castaneum]|eukprot:XP_008191060.1 PREDICTED: serrate RNA effector molecule homolog isoform X1 [Tribolium castaneum]
MADSDDEYDRKRRDKFRGERAEATYRGAERVARPRDDWAERDSWSRPRPREYRPGVRDRGYSPSLDPAPKRLRHDYYADSYYNHYSPYHQSSHRAGNFFREPPPSSQSEGQQPPMMSFKAFLATQDDNISDSEAIEKYNDYKLEFQRQQLNEFFVAHKDDEWFRLKYHPEDSVKRKEEQMAALKKRVEVFLDLMNNGKLAVSVDCSKTNDLLKLLDTVVIKLEGGTEEDLAVLEQEYAELEEKNKEKGKEEVVEKPNDDTPKKEQPAEKPKPDEPEAKENGETTAEDGEIEQEKKEEEEKPAPEENKEPEKMEVVEEEKKESENPEPAKENEPEEGEEVKKEPKDKKRKRSYSGSSSGSSSSSSDSEDEKEKKEKKEEEDEETEKDKPKEEVKEHIETVEDDKPEKPKSLHKTTSIFLRNLAPTITKQEVEAVCGRYEGFLRVALADPQPERRWLRRGWVTFKRDANIKEICWNLNNIRLRDCELGAIVNRDLSRRIRPVNGITAHKQVVRSDIRISAKVALHLDNKVGLWLDDEKKDKPQQTFGLVSNNPVLHNITDYLIEEASAEEEELLGLEPTAETQDSATTVERDEQLISVLDRIILYLRVVHSVDYYNHCEYPNEDEMPNRCGILHARGPPPTTKTDMTQFIGAPVEAKMTSFLPEKPRDENKNETKLINLSLKDVDTEIDKFVQANTRELAKDKWLCPLSGKKFKGPDFVRKHIFNKHAEKIEEVKKEVEFFNNYLRDPKRPMLAEAPQPKREEPPSYNHPSYGGSYGGYGRLPPYYNQGYSQRSRGYTPRSRGGPGDYRPVIHYRDLDAPREPEEFI